jgi:hypothetical protein
MSPLCYTPVHPLLPMATPVTAPGMPRTGGGAGDMAVLFAAVGIVLAMLALAAGAARRATP